MVDAPEFTFEFHSEVHLPYSIEDLVAGTEAELRELAAERTDMIGASVALEELTGSETPHQYQARIVVYVRPENVVAVEKAEEVATALQGALKAVERQIREQRERLGRPWEQPS